MAATEVPVKTQTPVSWLDPLTPDVGSIGNCEAKLHDATFDYNLTIRARILYKCTPTSEVKVSENDTEPANRNGRCILAASGSGPCNPVWDNGTPADTSSRHVLNVIERHAAIINVPDTNPQQYICGTGEYSTFVLDGGKIFATSVPECHAQDDALLGSPVEYASGATLFRAGDRVQTLFYIVSGRVRLVVARDGGQDVTKGIRNPGWLLGAGPAVRNQSHRATAFTVDPCVLRPLSRPAFVRAFETTGEVSRWVARRLADDDADDDAGMATLGGGGGTFRLLWFLAAQARGASTRLEDGSRRLHDTPSRNEIARAIGVSPVHAGRLLAALMTRGDIRREKGRLVIPVASPILDLMKTLE